MFARLVIRVLSSHLFSRSLLVQRRALFLRAVSVERLYRVYTENYASDNHTQNNHTN